MMLLFTYIADIKAKRLCGLENIMNKKQKIIILFMACAFVFAIIAAYRYAVKKDDFLDADIEVISDLEENTENSNNGTTEDNNILTDDIEIKVLLSNQGGFFQADVRVTCDTTFYVYSGDEKIKYKKNTEVDITNLFEEENTNKIEVVPKSDSGKITVLSMEKGYGSPCYRGKICIYTSASGYYLINELPLEEYLYAVVSSEMPSSYESEALKAQAVCARTYAVKKMQENAYEEFGADICDTTASQVYNNTLESEASIQAVNETKNLIMTCDGEIVDAYFFSTSCGTTCRNDDVWDGSKRSYLNDKLEAYTENDDLTETAVMVTENGSSLLVSDGGLSKESLFEKFINNEIYFDAIEKDASLYRWHVTYSLEQLENILYEGIFSLLCEGSDDLQLEDGANDDVFSDIGSVADLKEYMGEIENVEAYKRGYSGIAESVIIYASNASFIVKDQLTIRKLFNPSGEVIINQAGDELCGWSMLPSAYFYIDKDTNGGYIIYGGGFGHGVGMSQNGANALATEGYKYTDILMHYFDGANIENLDETGYIVDEKEN